VERIACSPSFKILSSEKWISGKKGFKNKAKWRLLGASHVAPIVAHFWSLASFISGRLVWILDIRPKAQNSMLLGLKQIP